jgi:hypothetical protein
MGRCKASCTRRHVLEGKQQKKRVEERIGVRDKTTANGTRGRVLVFASLGERLRYSCDPAWGLSRWEELVNVGWSFGEGARIE